jgi:hypothetical protein
MAQQAFYTKINASAGVQFSGGTIAQATAVLHTNNILYFRGGSSGLVLSNYDGSEGVVILNDHIKIETAGAERLRVTSAGKVGIGTSTPTANLYVSGSNADATDKPTMISESVFTVKPVALNSGNLNFAQVDSGNSIGMQYTNGGGTANWDISMQPFGGNVGIGTVSPGNKLHVNGGEIQVVNGTSGKLLLQNSNNYVYGDQNGVGIFNANDNLRLYTVGSERMRITSTGNVGINATSPTHKLTVNSGTTNVVAKFKSSDNQAWISVQDDASGTYGALFGTDTDSGEDIVIANNAATKRFSIDSNGKTKLHAYGSGSFTGTAAYNLQVDSSGNIIETAAGGSGTVTGNGTATYLPIWTSGSALDNSIISSSGGDVTINGSDNDPRIYINPLGGDIGDTALIQFNSRGIVGYTGGLIELGDNGQSKDVRLRVNSADLIFQTSNTTRMTVKSTGLVGIGTTSPTGVLDVLSTDAQRYVRFRAPNGEERFEFHIGSTGNGARLSMFDHDGTTEGVRLSASGNSYLNNSSKLGINTSSPSRTLHVAGAGGSSGGIMIAPTSGDAEIQFQDSGVTNAYITLDDGTGDMNFRDDSATVLTVDFTNEKVGIGTTSPDNKLDVVVTDVNITPNAESSAVFRRNGNNYISILSNSSNWGGILFGEETDANDGALTYNHPSGYMVFETRDAERMRIDSSGNVGIGLTNPVDRLDLYDADDNVGIYFHTATSGTGGGNGLRVGQNNANAFVWNYEATPLSLATGGTARLTINATGGIRFNTGYGAGTLVTDANGNITVSSGGGAGGPYLPLTGGTMTGNIVMGDNDITGIDELVWTSGTKLGDGGNTQYLRLTYAGTAGGGMVVKDGDNSTQGYLYADGQATSSFGLLHGGGSWAVRCVEDEYVELRYNNSTKFRTSSTGVTITGNADVSSNVLVGGADSYFGENVLRFKSAGAAYIDHNTTGQSLVFRTSNSSSLDTSALTITSDGYATFVNGISATNTSFSGTVNIASPIYHIGDTNTYFGFNTADSIQLVTGGGQRLLANNNGVKIGGGATVTTILDEDNMASDSATALATQQSIKAYVDNSISGGANYLGVWDPDDSLNNGYGNPSLQASTRSDTSGDYFICSADGSAHPNGGTTEPDSWHTGDWVVWNEDLGSSGLWQKIDNTTVLSGGGTANKVAKFTDSETIGDGPITFSTNDSTFAGRILNTYTGTSTHQLKNGTSNGTILELITSGDGRTMYFQSDHIWSSGSFYLGNNSYNTIFRGNTYSFENGNATFAGQIDVNGAVSTFGAAGTGTGDAVVSIDGGSGTGGEAYLRLTRGGTSGFILNHTASAIQVRATANIPMYFYTNDTVALTLSTSQNATFAGNVTATNILTVAGAATGSPYLQFTQGGTQKAYIQYADSGDSFELQSDNQFVVRTGGSTPALTINSSQNATFAGDVSIPVAKKLYFGGGSHTYIGEDIDDRLRFFVGGAEFLRFTEDTADTIFICQNAKPLSDSTIDLGSTSLRYANIWVDNINGGTPTTGGPYLPLAGGTLTGSGNVPLYVTSSGSVSYIQIQNSSTGTSGTSDGLTIGNNGTAAYIWNREQANLLLGTNDTTAVTIDSSQNATFAGTVLVGSGGYSYKNPKITADTDTDAPISIVINNQYNGSSAEAKFIVATYGNSWHIGMGSNTHTYGNDLTFTTDATTSNSPKLRIATNGNATFAGDVTVNGGDFNLTKQSGSPTINMLWDGNNPSTNTLLHYLNFQVDYSGSHQDWGGIEHRTTTSATRTKLNFNVKSTGGNIMNALSLDGTTDSTTATFAGDITISNATPALNLTDTDNSSNIALSSVGGALIVNSTSDQVYQIGGTEYFRVAATGATFAGDVQAAGIYVGATNTSYDLYNNGTSYFNGDVIVDAAFNTSGGAASSFSGDLTVGDELTITTISNATADPDKFLCASSGNKVGYRTGAQVLSDIGAAPATGGAYLPLAGGTMTGDLVMDGNSGFGNVIALASGTLTNTPSLKFYTYNNTDPGGGLGTGTGNIIQSDLGTGGLIIRQTVNDADIIFQSDDGSGDTTEYFRVDGGITKTVFVRDTKHLDSKKALFGDQDDLQIYHDGSNSYISNATADLYIQSAGDDVVIQGADDVQIKVQGGEVSANFGGNGGVDLYHNNVRTFSTGSTGITVQGNSNDITFVNDSSTDHNYLKVFVPDTTVNALGVSQTNVYIPLALEVDGIVTLNNNLRLQDSDSLQLGNSQDMELYHSSGSSKIDNKTGHLYIRANVGSDTGSNIYIQAKSGENSIICNDDGSVNLYYNNSVKFYTGSSGVGAVGYYGFGSAGTSTGSSYYFRYGSQSAGATQGLIITTSDTGGSYFDGVAQFRNTNTGQGAGMFQMINYGALYGRYMNFYRGSTSNIIGYIGYNATNTAVTYSTSSSDIRLKKNIVGWDEEVLPKFLALTPKKFDFKAAVGDKGADKVKGFIAQYEAEKFPEVYQLNGVGQDARYGFHPMEMVPYLMKAVKELAEKNEDLERRLAALEK